MKVAKEFPVPVSSGRPPTKCSGKLLKMRLNSTSSEKLSLEKRTSSLAKTVKDRLSEEIQRWTDPFHAPVTAQCRKLMLCKSVSLLDEIIKTLDTKKPGKWLREAYGCLVGAHELCNDFGEPTAILVERAHFYVGRERE